MRAGTQTLIQALQALPWAGDSEDDDLANITTLQGDEDSDEDSEGWQFPALTPLSDTYSPSAYGFLHPCHLPSCCAFEKNGSNLITSCIGLPRGRA
jgi:hypothetical protein